ncbi:MAG: dihydroorotate dehydrogenase electron transfer subunit [Pseudomonadota bacterium]
MKENIAKIISNVALGNLYFRMRLKLLPPAPPPRGGRMGGGESFIPGQFVMVKIPDERFLLRRPFGIASLDQNILEITFKVVGKGTEVLSKLGSETSLEVLGPLGNGFSYSELKGTPILIAGGYGVIPIFALAKELSKLGLKPHLFYGASSEEHFLYLKELEKFNLEIHLATDDGSLGYKGFVTELLKSKLDKIADPVIFASGPILMLKTLKSIADKSKIACQLSLEERMACGFGVCMGCACKGRDGYVRVCKEGPVFDSKEVDLS